MADEIAPADGASRPAYSGITDENAPAMDEKGGAAPEYTVTDNGQGSSRR